MNLNKLLTGYFLAASFFTLTLDKPVLDNFPYEIKHDYGPDNIYLKDRVCFAIDRDFTNNDLNHFCRKVDSKNG